MGNYNYVAMIATMIVYIVCGKNNIRVSNQCAEDFVASQGSQISETRLPPIPDYIGWGNGPQTLTGMVDYLGIANDWIEEQDIGISFGTKVSVECNVINMNKSKVRIKLKINTKNAHAFAFKDEYFDGDWMTPPTIFGSRAQDIVNDPTSKVGSMHRVKFRIEFSMTFKDFKKGNFPDLINFLGGVTKEQEPVEFDFRADGKDTDQNKMKIRQICTIEFDSAQCSKEIIKVTPCD
eukprot:790949_1